MIETNLHIIPYRHDLQSYFKELNIVWLHKFFVVEPIDEEMLSDPNSFIIDKGGHIFFAQVEEKIVGTFALMKVSDEVFELGKMAVDEMFQGQKIGHKLLAVAIEKTRELGARQLILYSNTVLASAIHLYKKHGFIEVPLGSSEYKRSNIKMEKDLFIDQSFSSSGLRPPSPEGEGIGTAVSSTKNDLHLDASRVLFGYAKDSRQEPTSAEELLWRNLKNRKLDDLKFRRQHPLHKYIADFYCHEKKLIVEIDGGIHNKSENREYDQTRDQHLIELGYKIMRVTNDDVLKNMSATLRKIKETAKNININSIKKQ